MSEGDTPFLKVLASKGADVPDSVELHNRQPEMHFEVELLEQLRAAGVVVRRGDQAGQEVIYDFHFKNGSWVYRAVGTADSISGRGIVILREIEEEQKGTDNES